MTVQWLVALDQTFKIERQWEDENGFLHVWGQAAVEGTMDYPEHGFKAHVPAETLRASVDGLIGKPVTREHPPGGKLIKPADAKNTVLGTVMDASFDEANSRILVHAVVYDAELKSEIQTKRRYQISPGYLTQFADLKQPTADGATKYQAKRVYNHLAFVEAARGGAECVAFDAAPPAQTTEKPTMAEENKNADPKETKSFDADAYRAEMDGRFADMKKSIDSLADLLKAGKKDKDKEDEEDKESMDSKSLFARMKAASAVATKHSLEVADSDDIEAYEAAVAKAYTGKDVPKAQIPGVLFAADSAPAKTDSDRTREQFRNQPGKKETKVNDSALADLPPAEDWHLTSLRVK